MINNIRINENVSIDHDTVDEVVPVRVLVRGASYWLTQSEVKKLRKALKKALPPKPSKGSV